MRGCVCECLNDLLLHEVAFFDSELKSEVVHVIVELIVDIHLNFRSEIRLLPLPE